MRTLAAALATAAALAVAAPASALPQLVRIADAAQPVYIAAAPGDATGLYIVEKAGRVLVLREGVVQPEPFLQVPGLFVDGEGGLLSVAFAPDYETSGLFYTYSSTADLHIEIAEYRRSADPGRADPASRRVLLRIPHPGQTNHWGGQLQFGPDGFLYAGTGDGGGGNDPADNAENLGSLLGKLLRIDPRGATPYAIPPGNPFSGVGGARPEIWAFGLRNPWRFSFDRATGDLTIGDVGQNAWEEVDFAPRGTGAGAFYGWDAFEGTVRVTSEPLPAATHTPPVLVRPHSEGDCSITGGYVVRAPDLPSLGGRYVHADFCAGVLRSAVLQPGSAQGDAPVGLTVANPSSFGEDLGGCIYIVSLQGGVFRLTESPAPVVPCAAPAPPPPPAPTPVPAPDPAPPPAPSDKTPPETTIERGPASRTTNRRVTVVARVSEPARFECSLDGGAFAACTLPFTTPQLAEGPHGLAVRAVDAAGNVELQPASWAWRVDLDPLRRWDIEVLLGRLARAVRSGRPIVARLEPHAPGRISAQLRLGGRLLASDTARAAPGLRIDLGRPRTLRPLVITGRFGSVSLTRRVGP